MFLIKRTLKVFRNLTQNLSHFWWIFLSVPSKYTSKCQRELSEDGVLWRFFGFYIFLNFELKCLDFAHEISTSLSKLLPNSLEEILDDNLFQERKNPSFIFGLWPKFLLTFNNDLSAGLPKILLALLDEHFVQWKFSIRGNTYSDVLWVGSTFFQNVCKNFRLKLLKILSRCRDESVEQFCFKKFLYFHFCLTFSGKFFDFPKKLCLSKLQFTCPNENVFGFVFFGKGNVIIALKLRSKSHRNFDWIFCAWLSKLHSKSSEEFCDKICFWSKELYKFFVLWHKTYRTFDGFFFQFRPNTVLSVNRNCLRMVFFDVFWLLYRFKLWAKMFRLCPWN